MSVRRAVVIAGLVVVALGLFLALFFATENNANAGIGPAGFAFYARQGILHGIQLAYGKGNNPYNVRCTEVPNYRTISDVVTCRVTLKP
jgi:hypothetical protein